MTQTQLKEPVKISFEPKISELEREGYRDLEEKAEWHNVPFGSIYVDSLGPDSVLRAAVSQYYEPAYTKDSVLYSMFWNVAPSGMEYRSIEERKGWDFPVLAKIVLIYPLNDLWEAQVELPANQLGSIYGLAADMYRYIYRVDDLSWAQEGHDKPPRVGETPDGYKIINRARGKHVWGHDMSDLVFEQMGFVPNPKWPTCLYRNLFVKVVDEEDEGDQSETEEKPERITKEDHAGKRPFIGTFIFAIGS